MDVEDLAAAGDLAHDRIADQAVAVLNHVRLDREPVFGRGFDDAHVPHAPQGHVQRPRDRSRGQRQRVHRLAPLLDPLFLGNPEPVLFVNHQQAQVVEGDVLRQQPVGADDDVDAPGP